MAVDEALLDDAATHGTCWLRFYNWAEPTLSLGYFQSHEERLGHRPSRQCPLVRRMSGGGAILHDAEITYSLAIPLAHGLADDSTWLYTAVHEALVEVLYTLGIEGIRLKSTEPVARRDEPFLCFQRRAAGDVTVGTAKICGSAQRRRRGAILQHGSLILNRSGAAPELPGLAQQVAPGAAGATIVPKWSAAIARHLNLNLESSGLNSVLLDAVRTLALEKYSAESWTRRR
jgi:lipoyl(octanoyl) transferase